MMCCCLWSGLAEAFLWEISALVRSPAQVVLVGLESSGKTTILFRLRYGQYVNAVPTVGFNTEKIRAAGRAWLAWDVGGAERVRPLWRSYTRAADALVFVVDSTSPNERLEEAKLEIHRLVKQQGSQCLILHRPRPPVLILANKQDLRGAREPKLLSKILGLHELPESQLWAISPSCGVTGEGLEEAWDILQELMTKATKPPQQPFLGSPKEKQRNIL